MNDKIKYAIRELAKDNEEIFSIICKVESVDLANKNCYCVPIDNKADLMDIKLIADNKKGFIIIPKVGSVVIVSMTSNSTGYISMFSEVEEIQLNGDNYGGLPQIQKLVEKYNVLEKSINDLKTVFTSWVPVPNDGGAALKTAITLWVGQVLNVTQKSELENTTVKHGNG